jgi:hypothetical protein
LGTVGLTQRNLISSGTALALIGTTSVDSLYVEAGTILDFDISVLSHYIVFNGFAVASIGPVDLLTSTARQDLSRACGRCLKLRKSLTQTAYAVGIIVLTAEAAIRGDLVEALPKDRIKLGLCRAVLAIKSC